MLIEGVIKTVSGFIYMSRETNWVWQGIKRRTEAVHTCIHTNIEITHNNYYYYYDFFWPRWASHRKLTRSVKLPIYLGGFLPPVHLKNDFNTVQVSLDGHCAKCVNILVQSLTLRWAFLKTVEFSKKASQGLVCQQSLELVWTSLVESVPTFHLPACYGHVSCKYKNKLSGVCLNGKKDSQQTPQVKFYSILPSCSLRCSTSCPTSVFLPGVPAITD